MWTRPPWPRADSVEGRLHFRCRSRQSFFAQQTFDLETLEAHWFFLVYHGKGYTYADVRNMTSDELDRHVKRLVRQLEDEKRAHEEQAQRIKAQSKRR